MEKMLLLTLGLVFAVLSVYLWQAGGAPGEQDFIMDGVEAPDILTKHTEEFNTAEVITVTDGVHVAIGFALANSILLEGPEGLVVVDTTESEEAAQDIMQHFRQISTKPIKAIVYTHNHADHIRGAKAFIEDPDNPPIVIAHELLPGQLDRQIATGIKLLRGGVHQFGTALNDNALMNAGLGPRLKLPLGETAGYSVPPSVFITGERQEMDVAGLHLVFIHIPGETPDQMGVWMPERRILLPADDIYKTFPNLYAIRGTPPRDVQVWAQSMHKMAALRADILVPSHTKPVIGEEVIYDLLTTYGTAIEYVHDQAVRCMNQNIHPDEAAKLIKLPSELATHPYLLEFYGTVEWSIKAVYNQYLGWFSGDPVELFPLPPKEKAKRMVDMMGITKLLQNAQDALYNNDYQWALELASYVFKVYPANTEAKILRLETLRKLASTQTSANGRHFYLTAAMDDFGRIEWIIDPSAAVMNMPIIRLLQTMKSRLKPEVTRGVTFTLGLNYTDIGEVYTLRIEHSVLRVIPVEEGPLETDVVVTTTSVIWKQLVLRKLNPVKAYMFGDLVVDGSLWQLRKFMTYFDRTGMK